MCAHHTTKMIFQLAKRSILTGDLQQGYLALVLAFEYRLSVTAVDACAHHADVTNKRALRIEKYYNARSQQGKLCIPKTISYKHRILL